MNAVMLDVPESLLEKRRLMGADKFDEMWEGVLHMVPPASGHHQRLGTRMLAIFTPLADKRGLVPAYESGLFRSTDDYRVPDQLYARPEHCTDRGFDGDVPLVVELLSPNDESDAKLGFYGSIGVAEALLIDPLTRAVELFVNQGGQMVLVQPGPDGLNVATLGIQLLVVDGPLLRIT
ncbi:MAG: Uma2 family endonuclease, partial [Pseudonocardiaceae bacterium]